MWLATKQAARRRRGDPDPLPDIGLVQNELGNLPDAILYRQLVTKYPNVERGPDQTISNHFERLKRAEQDFQAAQQPDVQRRQRDQERGMLRAPAPDAAPDLSMPWIGQLPTNPVTDLKGLPQRIPGWFTGDAMDQAPPDYGTPPMSRRDPMATLRAPVSPTFAPPRQSHEDWIRGLADKGIFLDPEGRRMSPEDMALPHRPVRGQDIWRDFARPSPYAGRHRAAKVVVAYITNVLSNHTHDVMTGEGGWAFNNSGNYYHKRIGDKIHILAKEPDGWIHNTGPADQEPDEYGDYELTGFPVSFANLQDAVMHAHRSKPQVGFKPPAVDRQSLSSTSWSDER